MRTLKDGSLPTRKEIELAIEVLELGFWEANFNRCYYALARTLRWLRTPWLHFGDHPITPGDLLAFVFWMVVIPVGIILWLAM